MILNLNTFSKIPMYVQIYKHIIKEIQTGRFQAGEKLPSKRKLAVDLNISQQTVESAYQQLIAEGYVESRPRSGIYVASLPETDWPLSPPLRTSKEAIMNPVREPAEIDFSHGKIDLSSFPLPLWRRLTNETFQHSDDSIFLNGDPLGELKLREEIASHLYQARGVVCQAEQVIIGAGTQYLLHLIHTLLGRHTRYGIENPGFHRTRAVWDNAEALYVPVPLDEEGVIINKLQEQNIEAVYITPSHQFPLGNIMPVKRRIELLQWASQNNSFIIEDDYDGEFRYEGKPIPALQGLPYGNEHVIYLGTFSKTLLPSLRLSYMVLPYTLMLKFQKQLQIYKQTVSRLHQETLYLFMKKGHWQTHLNKMRTKYRKKQHQLIQTIHSYFGEKIQIRGENSGLHVLLEIKSAVSETELIELAAENQVIVYPVSHYYAEGKSPVPTVLLGFGGLNESEIEEGIRRLKEAWFGIEGGTI